LEKGRLCPCEIAAFCQGIDGTGVRFQGDKGTRLGELSLEDLPKVKVLTEKTEQGFKEMIDLLAPKRYSRARS